MGGLAATLEDAEAGPRLSIEQEEMGTAGERRREEVMARRYPALRRAVGYVRCSKLVNLSVALKMFDLKYNHISDLIPAFITVCEAQLAN